MTTPMRVLVVGDPYFTVPDFQRGLTMLDGRVALDYLQIETTAIPPRDDSVSRLREYAGDPDDVASATAGHDVLVVHGAPVTEKALRTPGLRLVCCARGGPVNVDVAAATAAGVAVCTTPGKNAEAVAELTIAFALVALRGVIPSSRELAAIGRLSESVFDGREYFGNEASGTTLGLIGVGHVGRHVAHRAIALGFTVVAHDPYLDRSGIDGVPLVDLAELLARADIVSLHARATPGAPPLLGRNEFDQMREGSYLINTAREQLVDEGALLQALGTGHLSGAALDVIEPLTGGARNPLFDVATVLITPHIGGATMQTLARGADMVAAAIAALLNGQVPPHLINPEVMHRPNLPAVAP